MYVDIYIYVYLDWCMCELLLTAVYYQRSRDKTLVIWVFMHCLSELALSLTEIQRAAPSGELGRG